MLINKGRIGDDGLMIDYWIGADLLSATLGCFGKNVAKVEIGPVNPKKNIPISYQFSTEKSKVHMQKTYPSIHTITTEFNWFVGQSFGKTIRKIVEAVEQQLGFRPASGDSLR